MRKRATRQYARELPAVRWRGAMWERRRDFLTELDRCVLIRGRRSAKDSRGARNAAYVQLA